MMRATVACTLIGFFVGCEALAAAASPRDMTASQGGLLSFPMSGQLAELNVAKGDRAAAGDVLARLDVEDIRLEITCTSAELAAARVKAQQLAAQLAAAQTQRTKLEAQLQEHQERPRGDAAAEKIEAPRKVRNRACKEIRKARKALNRIERRIAVLQEELEQLNASLKQATIRAPVAGIVTGTWVKIGQFVRKGRPIVRVNVAIAGREIPWSEAPPRAVSPARGQEKPNVWWSGFKPPVLNDQGHVAYIGNRHEASGPGKTCLMLESGGHGCMVACAGDEAPGPTAEGMKFARIGQPVLNRRGQVAFWSYLRSGKETLSAVWLAQPGKTHLVARQGMRADLLGMDATLLGVGWPRLNGQGHVSFLCRLSGERQSSSNALLLGTMTGIERVAANGDRGRAIPGALSHTAFGFSATDHRQVAFSFVSGSDKYYYPAIYLWKEGVLSRVASTLDHAPGFPHGSVYYYLDDPRMNAAGDVVFGSSVRMAPPWPLNVRNAIVLHRQGKTEVVVRSGEPAPGGGKFFEFFPVGSEGYVINAKGTVAFWATVRTENRSARVTGIWVRGRGRRLRLVARSDQPLGSDPATISTVSHPAINARGQIAFLTSTKKEPGAAQSALWVRQPDGQVVSIVRTGDRIEVSRSDLRIVRSVEMVVGSGNEDGGSSGLNNLGRVAFLATFEDGSSGVFVSQRAMSASAVDRG